jgi:hypothetical protein
MNQNWFLQDDIPENVSFIQHTKTKKKILQVQ